MRRTVPLPTCLPAPVWSARTFKAKGYRVISNDLQYYSYVLNRHLIGNRPPGWTYRAFSI